MDNLKAGLRGTVELKLAREHCVSRGGPWVFSTPNMVKFVELACHGLVEPHLGAGQNTVGTIVRIRHMAATPEGATVRAELELVEVDRRRLRFAAKVFDAVEQIGECEHERFVVDVDKAAERLAKKVAALGL